MTLTLTLTLPLPLPLPLPLTLTQAAHCAAQPVLAAPCVVSTLTREADGGYLLRP